MTASMTDPVTVAWDESDITFVARLDLKPDGHRNLWNGWVSPWLDRYEIERYIEWAQAGQPVFAEYIAVPTWDGDTLVVPDPQYADEEDGGITRYDPVVDDTGVQRWALGAWYWTWYEVTSDPEPTVSE